MGFVLIVKFLKKVFASRRALTLLSESKLSNFDVPDETDAVSEESWKS